MRPFALVALLCLVLVGCGADGRYRTVVDERVIYTTDTDTGRIHIGKAFTVNGRMHVAWHGMTDPHTGEWIPLKKK